MNLTFRNRIALYYMIVTAVVLMIVFSVIYFVVSEVVYNNLDHQLRDEAYQHTDKIEFVGDSIHFMHKHEWEEIEHKEVQLNPIFLQIIDDQGKVMDKSPNLKNETLIFELNSNEKAKYFNSEFEGKAVREVQIPVIHKGAIKGYIISAVFLESSSLVLRKLRDVMLISFPLILLGLFFVSRFFAGRSILPIKLITETTQRITRDNLAERIDMPLYKDELFDLTTSINHLLQRIEDALNRERLFTSDASHELRTPLASLRGTLEVLIRKDRDTLEYKEKISQCLLEIDNMSETIENLLQLARLDATNELEKDSIQLEALIEQILQKHSTEIKYKNLQVDLSLAGTKSVPAYHAQLIFENLISNAIKYSVPNGHIAISSILKDGELICQIADTGIGIKEEDLQLIFQPFYRSEALDHKDIKGNGLGLSIALKASESIGAKLQIVSQLNVGTTASVNLK